MSGAGFYHCSVKSVGRAKGRSVVAAAAYRSGTRLEDGRTGEVFDYRARGGISDTFILTPDNAPAWAQDQEQLWTAAEQAEPRTNGRLATELELALPHELTDAQRKQLVEDFLAPLIERHGVAADVAIHEPGKNGDHRNIHAHVLITHRELGPAGFGEVSNARTVTKKVKGREKEVTIYGIAANPADVVALRREWEQQLNRAYERAGLDIQVDHRSHKDRGIEREPTQHIGPAATAIERRGEESERGAANREITQRNAERERLAALAAQEAAIQAEIASITHYDRDQAESQWMDALTAGAIAHDEARAVQEARQQAGLAKEAEQGPAAARGRYAVLQPPQPAPEVKPEPALSGSAADIRMALSLSRMGSELEDALAVRGMCLAQVTAVEAEASHKAAALYAERKQAQEQTRDATARGPYAELRSPEPGRYAPRLAEGELVVVDGHGSVYRLTERMTGRDRGELEGWLAGIDRAALMNVTGAQEAMQAASLTVWKAERQAEREQVRPASWIEQRIAACAEQAARGGTIIRQDAEGERLSGAAALADRLTPEDERTATSAVVLGADAFAARLDEAGIAIVRVTDADHRALAVLRQAEIEARETIISARTPHHFAEVLPGELAAVNRAGDVFRINPAKLGQAAQYLETNLPGVVEARAAFEIEREKTDAIWTKHRAEIATEKDAFAAERTERAEDAHAAREVRETVYDAADAVETGIGTARKVLDGVVKAFETGFSLLFGWAMAPPKLTPQQAELEARGAQEQAETRVQATAVHQQTQAHDEMLAEQQRTRDIARTLQIDVTGDPEEDRFRRLMQRSARDQERDREHERER